MHWVLFEKDQYHKQDEMIYWCEQQFGQGKWIWERYPKDWSGLPDWTIHSMFGNTTFAFRYSEHCALFVLRWVQ